MNALNGIIAKQMTGSPNRRGLLLDAITAFAAASLAAIPAIAAAEPADPIFGRIDTLRPQRPVSMRSAI